jgi:hypothetical protein
MAIKLSPAVRPIVAVVTAVTVDVVTVEIIVTPLLLATIRDDS